MVWAVSTRNIDSSKPSPVGEELKPEKQEKAAQGKKVDVLAKKLLRKEAEGVRSLPSPPKAGKASTVRASAVPKKKALQEIAEEEKAASSSLEYKRGLHAESSVLPAKRPKREEEDAAAASEKELVEEDLLPLKVEKKASSEERASQAVPEKEVLSLPTEKRSKAVEETRAVVSLDECKQGCEALVKKINEKIAPSLRFVMRQCLHFYIDYQFLPHLKETRTYESLSTLLEGPSKYLRDPAKTKDVDPVALKEVLATLDELVDSVKKTCLK